MKKILNDLISWIFIIIAVGMFLVMKIPFPFFKKNNPYRDLNRKV